MKIAFYTIVLLHGFITGTVLADKPNTLTSKEKQEGFCLLFNGVDLQDWKLPDNQKSENSSWKVDNGTIHCLPSSESHPLIYSRSLIPGDFEIQFEWKEFSSSDLPLQGHFTMSTFGAMKQDKWTGVLVTDYYAGSRAIQLVTKKISVPVLISGISRSETPSEDAKHCAGKWNKAKIIHRGTSVQHWLNDKKIVDIDLRQGDLLKLKEKSKGLIPDQWLKAKKQGLCLKIEASDSECWYRNFKFRAITGDKKTASEESKRRTKLLPAEDR